MVSLITIKILWPCRSSAVVQGDVGHYHDHVVHDHNESEDINDYTFNDPDDHELGRPGGFSVFLPALSLFSHPHHPPPQHRHTPYSLLQSITLENHMFNLLLNRNMTKKLGVIARILPCLQENLGSWGFTAQAIVLLAFGPSLHMTGNRPFFPASLLFILKNEHPSSDWFPGCLGMKSFL